jgi:hypothetical protein
VVLLLFSVGGLLFPPPLLLPSGGGAGADMVRSWLGGASYMNKLLI